VIRNALPGVLASIAAESLLDASCGDFNWMRHVDLGKVEYIGCDVVPEMIALNRERYGRKSRRFLLLDVTTDELPKVDVILCRECFIHFSFKHIQAAIDNFKRSNSTFLLATTHVGVKENRDTHTGGWRMINLEIPPFNLPRPARLITEDSELGKCLGLWRLEEL